MSPSLVPRLHPVEVPDVLLPWAILAGRRGKGIGLLLFRAAMEMGRGAWPPACADQPYGARKPARPGRGS